MREADLRFLNQCHERTDTPSIARRHAIDFVHDETGLVSDINTGSVG